MDPITISAYIQAGMILVNFGQMAVADVRAMFASAPAMTDAQLNVIISAVQADADRRAALAAGDAGMPPAA
jgi:hypothetical protein